MRYCTKCGHELTDTAASCEACGTPVGKAKSKKPFYKKWWFWVIIAIAVIVMASGSDDNRSEASNGNSAVVDTDASPDMDTTPTYVDVDLQTMLDDLNANALKAEKTYQNQLVAVTGKIANFDSDGAYITIEPVSADEWNFETVMCNIQDDTQLDFLLKKSVGDVVTIKGEVTDIGEVLGFIICIDELT